MPRSIGQRVLAGLAAALVVGVLAGLASRVLMRLVVLVAGGAPRFSLVGTVFVVLVLAGAMLPGAVAAALGGRWSARVLLGLGAAFLLFESVNIPLQEDRTQIMEAGGLTIALALVVLAAFPAVIVAQSVTTARLARAWAGRPGGRRGHEPGSPTDVRLAAPRTGGPRQ